MKNRTIGWALIALAGLMPLLHIALYRLVIEGWGGSYMGGTICSCIALMAVCLAAGINKLEE